MDVHIRSVADSKNGLLSVLLDDGRVIELDLTEASQLPFNLRSDILLNDEELEELSFASSVSAARQKAVDYLSYGDMSRRTLEVKLAGAGYSRDVAAAAAEYYCNRGIVDDLRYAVNRAEYMKGIKNYGPRRIRQALYEKGVSVETIRQALDYEQFDDFSENLDNLLAKKYKPSQLTDKDKRQKVFQALYRYGYEQQEIAAAITKMLNNR